MGINLIELLQRNHLLPLSSFELLLILLLLHYLFFPFRLYLPLSGLCSLCPPLISSIFFFLSIFHFFS